MIRQNTPHRAQAMAAKARVRYGLNGVEPIDVFKIYTMASIACILKPLESKVSGIFLRAESVEIVLVNSSKSLGHQRYTMAHELYHAMYDRSLEGRACVIDGSTENEKLADFFATNFLIPEEGVRLQLNDRLGSREEIEVHDVIHLEQLFGVSHSAMLSRLEQLEIIDKNTKEIFRPNIRIQAREYGYDDSLYVPTNETKIISDYAEKAKLAFDKSLITFSKYEELLSDAGILEAIYGDGEEVVDFVD
ncbi:MAG: ImmA/IrrE family metallo-endopeptidase [Bacilli bacterium]